MRRWIKNYWCNNIYYDTLTLSNEYINVHVDPVISSNPNNIRVQQTIILIESNHLNINSIGWNTQINTMRNSINIIYD